MSCTNAKKILSHNLKHLRKQKNLSQKTFAKQAGITIRHYQELEAGRGNPTIEIIMRAAFAHKVTIDKLLTLRLLASPFSNVEVLGKFSKCFEEASYCAASRTTSGQLLWMNRKGRIIFNVNLDDLPKPVANYVIPEARTLVEEAFAAERELRPSPYTSIALVKIHNGTKPVHFKVYPVLVVHKSQKLTELVLVYFSLFTIDGNENHSNENYYDFVNKCFDVVAA